MHRSALLVLVACGSSTPGFPADGDDAGPANPPTDSSVAKDASAPDTGGEAGPKDLVPAVAKCAPSGNACGGSAQAGPLSTMRKDSYAPAYDEGSVAIPTHGGRVQAALLASVTGNVTGIDLDGQSADAQVGAQNLDWYHVWPRKLVKGASFWIAFHSRAPSFDVPRDIAFTVHTDAGDVSGKLRNDIAPAPLTSVSFDDAGKHVTIHVENTDAVSHAIDKLFVQGSDVTAAACIPETTLAAHASTMITVDLCSALAPGDAWTVALTFKDAPAAVGAGRLVSNHFATETWPSSDDCPFPGGTKANYDDHVSHGFDTFFVHGGTYACGPSGNDFVKQIEGTPNVFALVTEDVANAATPSHAIGILLGDESDGAFGSSKAPDSQPQAIATRSLSHWLTHPAAATYLGGSRNRRAGIYAGVADLAGMDFYVAACAPHATAFGVAPPLRGAYDYLRTTVQNHAPLPTWLYSQGLSSGWDARLNGITIADRQPSAAEAAIQGMSAIAAGGKGLMWFQTQESEIKVNPDTWTSIGALNAVVRALGTRLAQGAVTGLASASSTQVLVEAIRTPDAMIVPVITLASSAGPTDVGCALGQNLHWTLSAQSTDVSVTLPNDLAFNDAFEVSATALTDVKPALNGRTLTLSSIALDATTPVRLFAFAKDGAARADIKKALGL